jgi:predicted secreted protein
MTIATLQGQPIVIRLWEDRTRGELWVPAYDPACLALIGDDFLRIASNNAVENGERIFEFTALLQGTHRIVFEKRMGWKFTAEARREFLVEVQGTSEHSATSA